MNFIYSLIAKSIILIQLFLFLEMLKDYNYYLHYKPIMEESVYMIIKINYISQVGTTFPSALAFWRCDASNAESELLENSVFLSLRTNQK